MQSIRVLLADNQALFRAGVRAILDATPDINVVDEASDGSTAARMIAESTADVVLLSLAVPGLDSFALISKLAERSTQQRCIVFAVNHDLKSVCDAVLAGAAGYLLKESNPGELEFAIRAASRGEFYLSTSVTRHLIGEYLRLSRATETLRIELSPRQSEVLRLVAEGDATKTIARKLGVSVKTVEVYRGQLMDRLGIRDTAGLVRYAIRNGIIEADA